MKRLLIAVLIVSLIFVQVAFAAKTLTVYVSYATDEAKMFMDAFEKDTGIKVKWIRQSTGTILNRLRAEKNNPQADVWVGGSWGGYGTAADEGLFEPYVSPEAKYIPNKYKDPKSRWTGIYIGIIGFATNKNFLAKYPWVKAPTSWFDLLNPIYKNNIQMPNPGSSGTAMTTVAALIQMMGWDNAFAYLKDLDKNIQLYTEHGSAGGSAAGLGQCAIGIIFGQDILHLIYAKHYPLILSFPKEGTGYEVGGLALIKGAKHVEEAKTFIDWMLSKKAQDMWAVTGFYHFPTRIGAKPPTGWPPASEIKLVKYDNLWVGKNRDKIVERWTKEILEKK